MELPVFLIFSFGVGGFWDHLKKDQASGGSGGCVWGARRGCVAVRALTARPRPFFLDSKTETILLLTARPTPFFFFQQVRDHSTSSSKAETILPLPARPRLFFPATILLFSPRRRPFFFLHQDRDHFSPHTKTRPRPAFFLH